MNIDNQNISYPSDDRFDDFSIELVPESEHEWLAHFEELPNVSAYGDTPEEALEELAIAWQAMKESYQAHGEAIPVAPARKSYSGQFNVRIDKRVHRALAVEAARAGVSLNALVAQKLAISTSY
ncbi:MAG: toxin-antitoxin system HicB family antitoxin [Pseudomonadota bacterium]